MNTTYHSLQPANMSRSKIFPHVIFAIWVALLVMLPLMADNYYIRLATFVCMYGSLALSWNFIGGYAGYPSFSTADRKSVV